MTLSIKIKAFVLCILLFCAGGVCGYILKDILNSKTEYAFQYNFERLEPLTTELGLSDVQKALMFNILADHKNAVNDIMKQVDPKIKIQLHIMRENIKNILDEQQKEKYIKLLDEHARKRAEEQK